MCRRTGRLRSFDRFLGTELWWQRKGAFPRTYELVGDDGELYARLVVKGLLSCIGLAEFVDRRLDLRWSAFIGRGVRMKDADTMERLGRLRLGLLAKGEIRLETGRRFSFKVAPLSRRCVVADDMGGVQFTLEPRLLRGRSKVTIGTGMLSRREMPLMMSVAQYALVMMSQESAAGG